jgi:PKD repeat protein
MSAARSALRTHAFRTFALGWGAVALLLLSGCVSPGGNRSPIATITALPREGYAPLSVILDGSDTRDPDGDPVVYEWTFGDGETATGAAVAHEFLEGTYQVTLTVTDTRGAIGTASTTIISRAAPEGFVVRRYEWVHDGEEQVWDALLPYNLYQMYRARIRTPLAEQYDYPAYVLDPLDDPTLEDLATVLWGQAGGDPDAFVAWVLSFVQNAITYDVDPPGAEWPLYPLETLYDKAGDCEDTAILFVSLLRAKGLPSRLATVDTDDDGFPDHILALVPIAPEDVAGLTCSSGQSLTVLEIAGELYAVAETACAAGTLDLGCDPWGLQEDDVDTSWAF